MTKSPTIMGGGVVAIKYAGGVIVATDQHVNYGSIAMFENVCRMSTVGVAGDTLLAASGEFSDYQAMLKMIEKRAQQEFAQDDGTSMSPSMLHSWITRIMYNRRSKIDPLWNQVVVAGCRDGQPYLGTTDLYGTMYVEDIIAVGELAAHVALPLLRKEWRPDMTEAEARELVTKAMTVLFSRSTRASSKMHVGKVDASGSVVEAPIQVVPEWSYPAFVRGGGYRGDGSW